jgi:hypothetical protein
VYLVDLKEEVEEEEEEQVAQPQGKEIHAICEALSLVKTLR